ncbi:hypothetical protein [uncultured Roseibium sp.]|uniref:hypothetical protein n=1 Tax=uncultured Roseibium sp. TaxID=1936171 RepID=UPI00262669AA|nr:hypothetical protein [uncultured Roseibium sp.]
MKNPFKTLPGKITVGYQTLDIDVLDVIPANNIGGYSGQHGRISIDRAYHGKPEELANTVLHEVLHACFHTSGLTGLPPGETEELTVTVLGNALTQVFRDNPEFLDWVSKTLALSAKPDCSQKQK